jgi:hypothetical protein
MIIVRRNLGVYIQATMNTFFPSSFASPLACRTEPCKEQDKRSSMKPNEIWFGEGEMRSIDLATMMVPVFSIP